MMDAVITMDNLLVFATVLAPIVTALIQVITKSVKVPKDSVPLLALIVGIVVGFVAYPFTDLSFDLRMWAGALAGLSSVGLFELINRRTGTAKE